MNEIVAVLLGVAFQTFPSIHPWDLLAYCLRIQLPSASDASERHTLALYELQVHSCCLGHQIFLEDHLVTLPFERMHRMGLHYSFEGQMALIGCDFNRTYCDFRNSIGLVELDSHPLDIDFVDDDALSDLAVELLRPSFHSEDAADVGCVDDIRRPFLPLVHHIHPLVHDRVLAGLSCFPFLVLRICSCWNCPVGFCFFDWHNSFLWRDLEFVYRTFREGRVRFPLCFQI